jgi:hypothetical protein
MHSSRRTWAGTGRASTFLTLAAAGMLGASGCGLVLGLGDYENSDDGAGATGATGGSSSTSGSPGGSGPGQGGAGQGGAGQGGTGASIVGGSGVGGMVDECPVGSECVDPPPAGWTGPALFYVGDTPPVDCPAAWPNPVVANAGSVVGDFTCDACGCAAPTGAQCSVPTYAVHGDGNCTQAGSQQTLPANGTCKNTNGGYGAKVGASTPSGGTCAASGGAIQKDPTTWDDAALVCDGGAVAVCPGGVCAPAPEPPFGASLCVFKDGEEPGCPLAYPTRTVAYRGVSDTRSCGPCTCGAAGGVTCPSVVEAYGNNDCSGSATDIPYANLACNNDAYFAGAKFVNAPVGGSCPVAGGNESGGVAPTLPLTVCCK